MLLCFEANAFNVVVNGASYSAILDGWVDFPVDAVRCAAAG